MVKKTSKTLTSQTNEYCQLFTWSTHHWHILEEWQ